MEQILRENTIGIELPDFYYEYMMGMIKEEPPRTDQELFEVIGEFLMNGNRMTKVIAQEKCKDILKLLIEQKVIAIDNENRLTHAAEKLEKAVILNELDIMDSTDINQGYEDAFLGIQKFKMDDDNQDPMARGSERDKIQKQRAKQEQQQ